MNNLIKHYSETDRKLIFEIEELYKTRNYDHALKKITDRLESLKVCKFKEEYYLKIELAGYLIDIADAGKIKEAAYKGLEIIENEKNNIKNIIVGSSTEYNLGNAKSAIFKIQREESDFKYTPNNILYLIESKNHYWRAFKNEIDEKNQFNPQLVVNLANALSSCGRVVESLQYYDLVLERFPDHPQANASRAKELIWLKDLSGGFTQNLIYQAKSGYENASQSKDVPEWLTSYWKRQSMQLDKFLKELKFDESEIHKEKSETLSEYLSLSKYRRFCIDSHLTLSEHSLYCNCIGSRRDDLLICTPFEFFDAGFIPVMEKILNRLKSEYAFTRLLYYYSTEEVDNELNLFDSEVMFTELHDSESINAKSEMLRTSFRLNFGILDKIASAICLLYDLADKKESIYFESFWNPRNRNGSIKQKSRWEKINSINNISLIALYTQATDLNSKNGEWSIFKSWRNALEHNQLSLLCDKELGNNIFKIYELNPSLLRVDKKYFQNKTLHLLQFTRSAIFNFIFLVRNEGRKTPPKKGIDITHTFKFKNDNEN